LEIYSIVYKFNQENKEGIVQGIPLYSSIGI